MKHMTIKNVTRRDFIGKTAAGLAGAAVSSGALAMSAASYQRVIRRQRQDQYRIPGLWRTEQGASEYGENLAKG